MEQYLVGLLNGVAVASGKDFWHTDVKIEPPQAFYWMDRFCENEPLGHITMGALNLVAERLGEDWAANQ